MSVFAVMLWETPQNYKDDISQDPYFLNFVMSVFPRLISQQSHESAKGHKAGKGRDKILPDSVAFINALLCGIVCVWVVWRLFGELFS